MAENKNQHYVPQLYLRNFSNNGKQIGVCNIPSHRFLTAGTIKHEASEDYFYGKNSLTDEELKKVESKVGKVIRSIIETNLLPKFDSYEHFLILQFVITLHSRTRYLRNVDDEKTDDLYKLILSKQHGFDKESLKLISIKDENASQKIVGTAMVSLPLTFDLNFKLIVNQTNIPFWTSDNPVVLYNQFLETKRPSQNNVGLITKGLEVFCPISPNHYLFFFDSGTYKVGEKDKSIVELRNKSDVEQLNKLQFLSATENLYFDQSFVETYFKNFAYRFQRERDNKRFCFRTKTINENSDGILQQVIMPEIRCGLRVNFISTLRKAKKYQIGNALLIPRNREILELAKTINARAEKIYRQNKKEAEAIPEK